MAGWHRTWRAAVGLRMLGLALAVIAWASFAHLAQLRPLPRAAGIVPYGLAAAGFLGASAGAALMLLGGHLFDQVEISERWRTR